MTDQAQTSATAADKEQDTLDELLAQYPDKLTHDVEAGTVELRLELPVVICKVERTKLTLRKATMKNIRCMDKAPEGADVLASMHMLGAVAGVPWAIFDAVEPEDFFLAQKVVDALGGNFSARLTGKA